MAVRNQLVHCELCGEDYASTYRRCPFCNGRGDADWDEPDGEFSDFDGRAGGRDGRRADGSGRHLSTNTRGGGYGGRSVVKAVLFILSLALIVAAIWIVVFLVVPKLLPKTPVTTPPVTTGTTPPPVDTLSPNPATPTPPPTGSDETPPTGTDEVPPTGSVTAPPTGTVSSPPPTTAGLKLSSVDFTLDNKYPTNRMTATGGTGSVTWSISNTEVATISPTGLVTAQKPGTATITATDEAGVKATCIVRVSASFTPGGAAASPSPSPSPSPSQNTSAAKLNRSDFTLSEAYGTSFTLTVTGWDGAVTWSSSNTKIATVSATGVVKAVASGSCTISATLPDGTVLKCTVRVNL